MALSTYLSTLGRAPLLYRAKTILQESTAFQNVQDGAIGSSGHGASRPPTHREKRHPRPWHNALSTQTRIRMQRCSLRLQPAGKQALPVRASRRFATRPTGAQSARRLASRSMFARSGAMAAQAIVRSACQKSGDHSGVECLALAGWGRPTSPSPSSPASLSSFPRQLPPTLSGSIIGESCMRPLTAPRLVASGKRIRCKMVLFARVSTVALE
jgi:hypothetical protein